MKAEWVHFNSFAARLLNHDMVSWFKLAVWSLRDALETPPREDLFDCDVAAATQWIIHSGDLLFSVLEQDEEEPETDRFWSRPLWKGKAFLAWPDGDSGSSDLVRSVSRRPGRPGRQLGRPE